MDDKHIWSEQHARDCKQEGGEEQQRATKGKRRGQAGHKKRGSEALKGAGHKIGRKHQDKWRQSSQSNTRE